MEPNELKERPMKKIVFSLLTATMITACGQETAPSALATADGGNRVEVIEPAVIAEPAVALTTNADGETGYMIKAEFQLGTNSCRAQGVHYEMRQEVVNDKIEVTAYRVAIGSIIGVPCPADYSPVKTTVAAWIKVRPEDNVDVMVNNVGKRNRVVNADTLIN